MNTDRIDYIVMLISEFARHFNLTNVEAYRYISKYKGLELCNKHYGIMHTLSLSDNIESLAAYCRRMGGNL